MFGFNVTKGNFIAGYIEIRCAAENLFRLVGCRDVLAVSFKK